MRFDLRAMKLEEQLLKLEVEKLYVDHQCVDKTLKILFSLAGKTHGHPIYANASASNQVDKV